MGAMSLLEKNPSPSKAVALMGIAAAISAILTLVGSFFPLSALFLMLFLPALSSIIGRLVPGKWSPVYIVAASLLCFGVSFHDFSTALFYAIPAIVSGTLYGLSTRFPIDNPFRLFFLALLRFGLNYLGLLLSRAVFGLDFLSTLTAILRLSESAFFHAILPALVLAYSILEAGLAYLVIRLISKRFEIEERKPNAWLMGLLHELLALSLLISASILAFFIPMASFLLGVAALYWIGFSLFGCFKPHKTIYFVLLGILSFAAFLLCGIFVSFLVEKEAYMFFLAIFLPMLILNLIHQIRMKNPALSTGKQTEI